MDKTKLKPTGRKRGRPPATEQDAQAVRSQLLAAAAVAYGRCGYNGVSVEMILREAAVSRPTFYRYFADRYAVIDEVIKTANEDLLRAVLQAVTKESAAMARGRAAINAYFQWCSEVGPIASAIYSEIYDANSPAGKHREQIIQGFVKLLHTQAVTLGREKLDPLFYDTLVRSVEHLGSTVFANGEPTAAELARRRRIAERILLASLAQQGDAGDVPSLSDMAL